MTTATSTGARVVFQINNAPVLFANAVSYEVNHNLEPLYELDALAPAEYYETRYSVSFTVNTFRVNNRSAMSQGLIPSISTLLIQPELKATLLDKITLRPIFKVNRLKANSETFEVSARDLARSNITFVGISLLSDFNT